MNKSIFIILSFTLSILICINRNVLADNEGPLAVYSFEEKYGDDALDATDNHFDASIELASRVKGKIGDGLKFGPKKARVLCGKQIAIENSLITIEAWVNPDKLENGGIYRIIGHFENNGFYFQIRDHKLEVLYNGESYHYGTQEIPTGVWTHIAFTSNGTNIATFINTIKDKQTNINLPIEELNRFTIGARPIYAGQIFSVGYDLKYYGIMDEIRIWNMARTEEEIRADYNKQIYSPPKVSIENLYMVINYAFDEDSGATAFDTSGNECHGEINKASRVKGKIGNAILFGADDARVFKGYNCQPIIENGFITIETWIKPDKLEDGGVYGIIGSSFDPHGYIFQIRDHKLEVLSEWNSIHYGKVDIRTGVWNHVAFISDGANITTYINFIEDMRTNITLPIGRLNPMDIGAIGSFSGGYVAEFPGIMDEFKIWNGIKNYQRNGKPLPFLPILLLENEKIKGF